MPRQHLHRLRPNRRTSFCLAALFLVAGISAAAEAETHPQHIRNFGKVNDNLFRGGSPTDEALRELKELGVNLVLDLREDGPAREHEKQQVEKLGMRYEHIPLPRISAPSQRDIERALSLLLNQSSTKIYVHCLRGKDRTGTVIACYRIQHDRWDNGKALAEAKSYGMSSLEWAMQAYIRTFAPLNLP